MLDASALLALILGEAGADVVASHLEGAAISAVNLAEVGAKMVDRGATLDFVHREIAAAEVVVVPFDTAQAFESARLRPLTRDYGLSLGDRACLALGATMNRLVLMTDRDWTPVGLPVDIRLIR
ncbi:MAG TPA: type II toxin-antitoxin system VapC family toxin [Beijerinckiaceae bacterium]